ncbi:hypothetical protein E2C01_059123 [Portunus trituberculatus]|uniref:Uncharacterized protein n=1 Tax=Portunus trituberculatus TaxID=210409 RepID=A0A5B7GYA7_PORTR|nr:hypothetical protein [Portunus trituberculatus]
MKRGAVHCEGGSEGLILYPSAVALVTLGQTQVSRSGVFLSNEEKVNRELVSGSQVPISWQSGSQSSDRTDHGKPVWQRNFTVDTPIFWPCAPPPTTSAWCLVWRE